MPKYFFSKHAQTEFRRVYDLSPPPVIVMSFSQGLALGFCSNIHVPILEEIKGQYTTVGAYTYSYSVLRNIRVGNYCSIGNEIIFSPGVHPTSWFTSHTFFEGNEAYPFRPFTNPTKACPMDPAPIHVGHDVWIGSRAIIMGGLTIGNGAIIGSGAVVTKDVPPYAIVGGVPARVIRYRFAPEVIAKLEASRWWEWDLPNMKSREAVDWEHPEQALETVLRAIERGEVQRLPEKPALTAEALWPFEKKRRFLFRISGQGTFIKLFGRWLVLHLRKA